MKDNQEFIVDGFSSEEEILQEEVQVDEKKKQTVDFTHKQQIKFKIPPPQEIKKKSYSLTPDIATGWAPKSDLPVPIPLLFQNKKIDYLAKKILEKPMKGIKICYLGPRFENTYSAWYERDFPFPYEHIKAIQKMKFSNRAFFGQHHHAYDGLIFDSFFQSGNLDCAFRIDEREYELFLRVDSNTKGHIQWYFFKMKNLEKLQKYKINICNFQKCHSLYNRGMKPYFYSLKKKQKENVGWIQDGDFIRYERKPSKVAKSFDVENNYHYKLSFQYYTQYQDDEVYAAYCVPYTYSHLRSFFKKLSQKNKDYVKINKLCSSLGGLDVPLIIIHDQSSNITPPAKKTRSPVSIPKKCVLVSGRAHPGQSNGSYMMQGFIEFLCGSSKEAEELRKNVIFKIVPMLNPDGVALGNYRTGISGRDFNREYRDPDKEIFPEVYSFKKLVAQNKALFGDNLTMFLDFHGHSIKKNVFMYGPEFPIIERNYYETRVFPKILSNSTQMFRYYSCIFKISSFKVTTARAIMLRKLMIPCSYTIEASNGSYYDREILKDIPFNIDSWMKMGEKIAFSLNDYCQILIASEKMRIQRLQQKKNKQNSKTINAKEILMISKNEDKKLKILFDEIQKMEDERQYQKNSEDDMSEGSSDVEDEKEDLPASKMKQLFQIIKNKKNKINEKQKLKLDDETFPHFRTETNDQFSAEFEKKNSNIGIDIKNLKKQKKQEDLFGKKNNKLQLHRTKNQSSSFRSEKAREKVQTRIINFSFIGGGAKPRISKPPQLLHNSTFNKKIFFELYKDKGEEEKEFPEIKEPRQKNVLDLSQNMLRKTFGHSVSEKKRRQSAEGKEERNIYSPRKLSQRFEQFKYKRILLDQYEV